MSSGYSGAGATYTGKSASKTSSNSSGSRFGRGGGSTNGYCTRTTVFAGYYSTSTCGRLGTSRRYTYGRRGLGRTGYGTRTSRDAGRACTGVFSASVGSTRRAATTTWSSSRRSNGARRGTASGGRGYHSAANRANCCGGAWSHGRTRAGSRCWRFSRRSSTSLGASSASCSTGHRGRSSQGGGTSSAWTRSLRVNDSHATSSRRTRASSVTCRNENYKRSRLRTGSTRLGRRRSGGGTIFST